MHTFKRWRSLLLPAFLLALATMACTLFQGNGPPGNAVVVPVAANSSLAGWLAEATTSFNESKTKTSAGHPVFLNLETVEAGQAITNLAAPAAVPALWIPDDPAWANILADQGNRAFQADCASVAQSPLVIAMWQPLASTLGWPGRDLGWLDVGSLAADPSSWRYYSGGQYGDTLRLGHTHPGLSASGTGTLLAIVQAAEAKQEAVSVDEIEQPIVQASVNAFESAVSWFSSDTASLGQTMAQRGTAFLGAAVLYESTVVTANQAGIDPPLVPIYPFEGTFVATHPACLNSDAAAEVQEGARLFRDYLRGEEAQAMAVAAGLRPYNLAPATEAPADLGTPVDWSKPERVFASPTVDAVYAVQGVWQAARKDVNLVMLLDVSGSMDGDKIAGMRQAATQFVQQMGDDDFLTIVAFSHELDVVVDHQQVGPARQKIERAITRLEANGDTALYDAIGLGAEIVANTQSSQTSNALVVLTDGLDTFSTRYAFNQDLIRAATANDTTVFTIAYGEDADEQLLSQLAEQAYGNFYKGDEANIAAIYQELAAAFGGSLGVGR